MDKLTDESKMPFGKYKGKMMQDVPASYLDWFAGECKSKEASNESLMVLDYIQRNRNAINEELLEGEEK